MSSSDRTKVRGVSRWRRAAVTCAMCCSLLSASLSCWFFSKSVSWWFFLGRCQGGDRDDQFQIAHGLRGASARP